MSNRKQYDVSITLVWHAEKVTSVYASNEQEAKQLAMDKLVAESKTNPDFFIYGELEADVNEIEEVPANTEQTNG
ncbi:hypothetical protein V757_12195 [Pelistega indica]|uniref:Uncharacterized protein n=1 Tax=Pelistega indica TaxID=1414851 RepID=V8FS44_9BURK|nr:hypothetical protein [Pelistega indica]ETD66716.1 hypothetical protein V757_12195 [Pelistega indica]